MTTIPSSWLHTKLGVTVGISDYAYERVDGAFLPGGGQCCLGASDWGVIHA